MEDGRACRRFVEKVKVPQKILELDEEEEKKVHFKQSFQFVFSYLMSSIYIMERMFWTDIWFPPSDHFFYVHRYVFDIVKRLSFVTLQWVHGEQGDIPFINLYT